MATTNTKWTANETQKTFLKALADGKTKSLRQINAELGKDIKTGSVNTLISKGYVETIALDAAGTAFNSLAYSSISL